MNFSNALAFIAYASTAATAAAAAHPINSSTIAIDESDIAVLQDAADGPPLSCDPGKRTGLAFLGPAFVTKLRASAGGANPDSIFALAEAGGALVQTTFLSSTTKSHVDHLPPNEAGVREPIPEGEMVAFLPLETNNNAYTDVDDICIPIEAGKLVTFNGRSSHHTVVKEGSVSLLGPFHVNSMKSVGTGCNNNGQCQFFSQETCGNCPNDCDGTGSFMWSLESAGSNTGTHAAGAIITLDLVLVCAPSVATSGGMTEAEFSIVSSNAGNPILSFTPAAGFSNPCGGAIELLIKGDPYGSCISSLPVTVGTFQVFSNVPGGYGLGQSISNSRQGTADCASNFQPMGWIGYTDVVAGTPPTSCYSASCFAGTTTTTTTQAATTTTTTTTPETTSTSTTTQAATTTTTTTTPETTTTSTTTQAATTTTPETTTTTTPASTTSASTTTTTAPPLGICGEPLGECKDDEEGDGNIVCGCNGNSGKCTILCLVEEPNNLFSSGTPGNGQSPKSMYCGCCDDPSRVSNAGEHGC